MNSSTQTKAEGHTYYDSSYMSAADILEWIGDKLTEDGCYDEPNSHGNPYSERFKITITVEQV